MYRTGKHHPVQGQRAWRGQSQVGCPFQKEIMMDVIPRYLSPVSIIPGGCPQFLDFSMPEDAVKRLRRYFREEKKKESDEQTRYTHYLRCLTETENGFIDQLSGLPCDEDYSIEARRAL